MLNTEETLVRLEHLHAELAKLIEEVRAEEETPPWLQGITLPVLDTEATSTIDVTLLRSLSTSWRRNKETQYLTEGFVLVTGAQPMHVFGWLRALESSLAPGIPTGTIAVSVDGSIYVARKGTGAPIVWEEVIS